MRQDMIHILQLGTGFALIFSAFNAQGLIEVTVLRSVAQKQPETGISNHSGYYSLSIIYLFFTLFNLVTPPIVKKVGAKWSQVIGATGYLFFMITFLHLNVYLLYIGSAVLGAGAALLWSGNGVYIVQLSRGNKLERNSGIMWAMLQTSLIAGGIFLIFILRSGELYNSFFIIYLVFIVCTALGIATLFGLPNADHRFGVRNESIENSRENLLIPNEESLENDVTFWDQLIRIIKLSKSKKMLCLAVVFVYSGLEMTFYTGVFTSCLSATLSLKSVSSYIVPYSALAIGAGQIIGGLVTGSARIVSRMGIRSFILLASCFHLLAFLLAFLSLPQDSTIKPTDSFTYITPNLELVLLISFLLGLSDAVWQTQIYVIIGSLYKNDPENAFALFKFFQSLAASGSFFYSSILYLPMQLLILSVGCICSFLFFIGVLKTNSTTIL